MTCAQVDDFLDWELPGTGAEPSEEVKAHLEQCMRCHRLYDFLQRDSLHCTLSPETESRIRNGILADLTPVKPLAPVRYYVAAFLGIFAAGIGVSLVVFGGAKSVLSMNFWQFGVITAMVLAGATLLSWLLSVMMSPGSRLAFRPYDAALAILAVLVVASASLFPWAPEADFFSHGARCSSGGIVVSIPVALLLWALLRRGGGFSPTVLGATAGTFSGLFGALFLHLHCNNLHAAHVTFWHMGVVAIGFVLGWLAGRIVEARFRRPNHS